jgi:hypothetical protein
MFAPEPKGVYQPKPPSETYNAVCLKVTYEKDVEFGQNMFNSESDKDWAITTYWQLDATIPRDELLDVETGEIKEGHEIFEGKRYELTKQDRLSRGMKSNMYKYFFRLMGITIDDYLDIKKDGDPFVAINPKNGAKDIEWDDLVGMSAFIVVETKPTKKGHLFAAVKEIQKRFKGIDPIQVESPIQWPERENKNDAPAKPSTPPPGDDDLPF